MRPALPLLFTVAVCCLGAGMPSNKALPPDYRRIENDIAAGLNAYRVKHGLPPLARSALLDKVARAHVDDLDRRHPDTGTDDRGLPCNLHSWSAKGPWKPVCYTGDHAYAALMWSKPGEITKGAYPGYGYEIAFWSSTPVKADDALDSWEKSPGHRALMAQTGPWKTPWQAFGVGVRNGYAVIWFGREPG
jgi:uncharacterized protein YkwD